MGFVAHSPVNTAPDTWGWNQLKEKHHNLGNRCTTSMALNITIWGLWCCSMTSRGFHLVLHLPGSQDSGSGIMSLGTLIRRCLATTLTSWVGHQAGKKEPVCIVHPLVHTVIRMSPWSTLMGHGCLPKKGAVLRQVCKAALLSNSVLTYLQHLAQPSTMHSTTSGSRHWTYLVSPW